METKYDLKRCDAFVVRVSLLSNQLFSRVWSYLAFDVPLRTFKEITDQWPTFSLWEKQAILHKLVPVVTSRAKAAARLSTQHARINEPL